jgi:hypothetical protein
VVNREQWSDFAVLGHRCEAVLNGEEPATPDRGKRGADVRVDIERRRGAGREPAVNRPAEDVDPDERVVVAIPGRAFSQERELLDSDLDLVCVSHAGTGASARRSPVAFSSGQRPAGIGSP